MTDTLSWLKDPLLYDIEPTLQNKWLTANELIKSNRIKDIFISGEQSFNLYPILVRKIDFVKKNSSDRILSRFPYLVLTQEEKEQIQKKILLISEFTRDYFYNSINNSILTWRKRFNNYLERGAIPYPLFRCACEILQKPLVRTKAAALSFESARGKRYSIPTKLTNALAYLCGVANGDGHLHRHSFRVTDETKEFMMLLSKLYEQMFNDSGEIFQNENAWNVELRSSAVVRIINFLTDQTIEGAKYDSLREPLLFKQLGAPFRNIYWRGAMDADGSLKNQITFTSASERFVLDFKIFLDSLNMECTIQQKPSGPFSLYLYAKEKLRYVELIGSLNPKKSDDLFDFLQRNKKYTEFIGLKKNALTKDGYYNFDLLDSLYISGLGYILKEYRSGRSFATMDELLNIARGSYTNMEKDIRGLPYSILKKVLCTSPKKDISTYDVLIENIDKIKFHVSTSIPLKLPFKPIKELDYLLAFTEPKINYVLLTKIDNQIKKDIKKIFNLEITTNKISCRLLSHFLSTFYDYNEDFPTISVKEFYSFKKQWREEIFS